ncbi:MAG: hypothetical protein H6955_07480 [Chromatiaceae bacterium]|nr:hypothetical protein [Chromatiaceae bacterium]
MSISASFRRSRRLSRTTLGLLLVCAPYANAALPGAPVDLGLPKAPQLLEVPGSPQPATVTRSAAPTKSTKKPVPVDTPGTAPLPGPIEIPKPKPLPGAPKPIVDDPGPPPEPAPDQSEPPGGFDEPFPIVYSWSERTQRTATLNDHTISANAISAFDPLPEVVHIVGGFKEANLVYRDADGYETTIYDCIGDDSVICAALDGRVSPDATKVAFWVAFARNFNPTTWTLNGNLPIPRLGSTIKTQIHIYDIATGRINAWDTPGGQWDMHPEWISNDKLIFVSNRAKVRPVYLPGKVAPTSWALQRYTANADGSNAVNIGPHDDAVLHPYVLSDGNILSANFRADEKLSQGITTIPNQWWMTMTDQFGGHEFTVFGAHAGIYRSQNKTVEGILSLHFYGERTGGDLLTGNYYRLNHVGGQGQVLSIERLPHGVEGATGPGNLIPRITVINPYGQEEDNPTLRDPQTGRFYGKASWPVGIPGNQVMLTLADGFCYSGLKLENANDKYLRGGPGCNLGIYRTTRIPSKRPGDDMVKIVDDPDRHEFSPDIALPYQRIYGKPMPDQQVREIQRDEYGEAYCTLEVIDATFAELYPNDDRNSKRIPCRELGGSCIKAGYSIPKDLAALAIYEAAPNRVPQSKARPEDVTLDGHKLTLLGYARPEQDGSLAVRVPCETPIKMRGVAEDGTVFVRDQITHSLRSGEARRCIGCHGGHTENGYKSFGGMRNWKSTIAAGRPPQHLSPKL